MPSTVGPSPLSDHLRVVEVSREIGFRQFPPSRAQELLVPLCRRCRRNAYDSVIAVCRDKLAGISAQAVGSLPCLDCVNPPPEPLPEHNDAAIRGPQMLQVVDGNGPLTDLSFIVTGLPLARLVGVERVAGRGAIWSPLAHHAGVVPEVSLTCRSSMSMVVGVVRRHNPAAHRAH